MTAPGPAPDRADLAEAEQRVRALLTMRFLPAVDDLALEIVLAELDRQRALIAAVLAECDRRRDLVGANAVWISVDEIRALLEGEGR